ncbi:MAG: hypothetical protein KKA62_00350 [Nanoarchaeota archaeon]|nr:hypothetical protein [Nanoarchaeota archaeon]MBU1643775.1 hypothetical protein [Nanoarchaeota archaeon]MBU1976386.1 hypothetical protein [Nanoarchaeota archaeon]
MKKDKKNINYNKSKIKYFVLLAAIVLVFIIISSFAENGVDWNSPEQFEANFEKDPATAFSNNPETAWNRIDENPSLLVDNEQILAAAFNNNQNKFWEVVDKEGYDLMKDQKLWDFTFEQDRLKAAGVIGKNVEILDDLALLEKFDQEISSLKLRNGKTGVEIVNENPEAKKAWLEKKYGLSMEDIIEADGKIKNADILKYDGVDVTTGGEGGGTFTIKDVKGAKILKDGSLEFQNTLIKSTKSFSLKTDESGNEFYEMEAGEVSLDEKVNTFSLKVKGGKIIASGKGLITYECSDCVFEKGARLGQFIKLEKTGDLITGKFKRIGLYKLDYPFEAAVAIEVEGGLFQQEDLDPEEMIILGETKLVKKEIIFRNPTKKLTTDPTKILTATMPGDGVVINNEGPNQIYYTEKRDRDAATFCPNNFACIVNNPGREYGGDYQERLAFLNVQENDHISVKTPVYYNRVEILDQVGGEVTFTSTNKDSGKILGEIKSVAGEKPKLVQGKMEEIKTGRIDVLDSTDPYGQPSLYHWSSKKFQKDQTYFTSNRDHFATCTYGLDCEEIFAKEFGKVIEPKDKTKQISTTVIVSGDNANTPRSMFRYCQIEGCYIVNSRDSPPTTRSSKLIVTGHHIIGSDHVWRDPPETMAPNHKPIDNLYFGSVEGGSPLDSLPVNNLDSPKSVDYVAFSACNTANSFDSPDFKILQKTYPDLKFVQGWSNKAPLFENIHNLPTNQKEIKKQAQGSIVKNNKGEKVGGEKSWYIKQADGTWKWTNGRQEPKALGSSDEFYEDFA